MTTSSHSLKYFHAGALFNLKELAGNALLASAISRRSNGRYSAILPQDLEIDLVRTSSIRDTDILSLLGADMALFNFDGSELDSGTVVEFMVAKFADIPSVLLRTDFRRAGDNHSDPWNLMVSDYPRTRQVIVHAMELYHSQKSAQSPENAADQSLEHVAVQVIEAFDELRKIPPVLDASLREPVYQWLAKFAALKDPHALESLNVVLTEKVKKGLL